MKGKKLFMKNFDYIFFENYRTLIEINSRDKELINFKENKNYNSIFICNYKLGHFIKSKKSLCVRSRYKNILEDYSVRYTLSNDSNFPICINICDEKSINSYAKFWIFLYDDIYGIISPDKYSCCSRFLECSDLLHCVNPNTSDRAACYYRRNLLKGYVFYGKNSIYNENGIPDSDKIKQNLKNIPEATIKLLPMHKEEQVCLI